MSGISLGRSRHPQRGGIRSLLAPKNITEVRVGMRTHVYLAKSWTEHDFQEDMLKQRYHLPFLPPPKRELLQSCKHFYHVFTNSALDELAQIFSSFALSQARDIHPQGVGGTCPDTFNIPFQAFLEWSSCFSLHTEYTNFIKNRQVYRHWKRLT